MSLLNWHRPLWAARFGTRNVPASLMLTGARGSGVREFGIAVAEALLCARAASDGLACGECDDCRWSALGRHPDLLRLGDFAVTEIEAEAAESPEPVESPEPEEGKGTRKDKRLISVDAIRGLIGFFQVSANRDRARVAVLSPAEWMNTAAANSLLKILEEPPPRAYLVLVSHSPARLPATIRSRCVRIPVPDPSQAEAQGWLRAQGIANPELVLAQTGGSPLAASDLSETYWDARSRLLPALARDTSGRRSAELLALADRMEMADCHRLMHTWCADLAIVRAGAAARFHPDYGSVLERIAATVSIPRLMRYESRLRASRRWLDHPMNPKLAVEDLLLGYLAIFEGH